MAVDHLSLMVWSVQLESLRCAEFARADKGVIVIQGSAWSLLILPCLGEGRLLWERRVWDCSSQLQHHSPASACFHEPGLGICQVLSGVGRGPVHGQNVSLLSQGQS